MLSGKDHGAARSTDGVGDEAIIEAHALVGDSVEVWRLVAVGSVGADRLVGVIITEQQQDVRAFGFC